MSIIYLDQSPSSHLLEAQANDVLAPKEMLARIRKARNNGKEWEGTLALL